MLSFVLYLSTGIITAIPVWYAVSWGVWGRPTSTLEIISLLGSLVLIIAAFKSLSNRALAARMASIAVLGVWACYGTSIITEARIRSSDQELSLSVYLWTPSGAHLTFTHPRVADSPPPAEIRQIQDSGITGTIFKFSCPFNKFGTGKKSHVTLVMQRPVSERVLLKEPDATSVVYVQLADGWKMFPPTAPTLERTIQLEPIPDLPQQHLLGVEEADGSRPGFGIWWPEGSDPNSSK